MNAISPFSRLLAVGALVLASPVLAAAAIGIRLSSRGPILYRAERAGLDGRVFTMYKLRTMHLGVEGSRITGACDHRVFRFGGWLRRLKIDELPQLINILRGEMAFIGPRAEDPSIVRDHYAPCHLATLGVLPGLASPGSIYYYTHLEPTLTASDLEKDYVVRVIPTKLALDLVYVRRASIAYDCRVAARTVYVIAGRTLGRKHFPDPPEMAEALSLMEDAKGFPADGSLDENSWDTADPGLRREDCVSS